MHDHSQDSMDPELRSIFRQGIEQPYDDAFRMAVCRKIRRRSRIRRAVLAAAIATGSLIALWPAYQLTLAISEGLAHLSSVWNGVDWSLLQPSVSVVAIVALVTPLLTVALEE